MKDREGIFWRDLDVLEVGRLKHALNLGDLRSAGDAPGGSSPISFDVLGEPRCRDQTIETGAGARV